jgi:hypothetical protein
MSPLVVGGVVFGGVVFGGGSAACGRHVGRDVVALIHSRGSAVSGTADERRTLTDGHDH